MVLSTGAGNEYDKLYNTYVERHGNNLEIIVEYMTHEV